MMRRKPGQLLPLETSICATAWSLLRRGTTEFYGYQLATHLRDASDSRLLTAYGTLYRALMRLEDMGLLTSRWEDPEIPARENRPGRRLYSLTAAGEAAGKELAPAIPRSRAARSARTLRPA
jgi:DNA-binding PadR family transcriptional regulator